jgi:predicted TIM-barrel fold metal-dependent hydrolase
MLEGVDGVGNLLAQVPANRVLFGSHTPLFCFESATLKLKESLLNEEQLKSIQSAKARRLIASQR